jgi:conjugal transfer mating pair stabilization protein TraG
MAVDTLTVYAYGNVDALHGIFNAIAMVMGEGDFKDMVRLAIVLGFLTVAVVAALPGQIGRTWSWFITVTVITSVFFVPKCNVSIIDKLGQQPPAVVANVPWILGVVASVKSSVGASLTGLFETAFQTMPEDGYELPAELGYMENGVMFGSRLVRHSREADFSSLNTQGDTLNYLRNCIFPDLGREAIDGATERSTDLFSKYSTPNPALFSTYHADDGSIVVAGCADVWNQLDGRIELDAGVASQRVASRMFPQLPADEALAKTDAAMVAVYAKAALSQAASTAQQIMLQNTLINATADASGLYAASLDDPGLLMYSSMRTQAVQQSNAGWLVQGRIAEEALPVLRNITEAILYALFPIIAILMVASEGRALQAMVAGYLYVLVWVELWPPCFAIVSYLQTLRSAANLSGAARMGDGGQGLTLETATGIYSTAVSDVAIAAWMVTFVPVLAGALLFGMSKILAIAGASGAGSQGAANSAADRGTKGNLTMGNLSIGQQELSDFRSSPSMVRGSAIGGTWARDLLTGEGVDTHSLSSGAVSVKDMSGWGERMSESRAESIQSAQRASKGFETSLDTAFQSAWGLAKSSGASASRALGFDVTKVGSDGLMAGEIDQASKQIATKFSLGDSSAVEKQLGAVLRGGGTVAGAITALLTPGASSLEREALQKSIEDSATNLRQMSTQRKQDLVNQFRSNEAFESTRRSNQEATQRVDGSMREASAWKEQETHDLARAQQFQQAQEKFQAFSQTGEANWANEFYNFARANGVDPMHGRASTAELKSLLQRFVMSGEVFINDQGSPYWVPQQGQGPNIIQGRFDGIDPPALEAGYATDMPGAGRDGVLAAGAANIGRAQAAQSAAGLSPGASVSSGDLEQRVGGGQAAAEGAVSIGQGQVRQAQGAAQVAADKRAAAVSEYHQPIYNSNPITGNPIRNKAFDAATLRARGGAQAFEAEGKDVQAARATDRAQREAQLNSPDKPAIPTAPEGGTK